MIDRESIYVGRKLFVEPQGNATYHCSPEEGTVSRVGRKYFYVKMEGRHFELRFDIENQKYERKEDTNSYYLLYDNKQEYIARKKLEMEKRKVTRFFRDCRLDGFPDEVGHEIYEILAKRGLISAEE